MEGLRMGALLWRVQLRVFLNQTVRSHRPARIVLFGVGVIAILGFWLYEAGITAVVLRIAPRAALPIPLSHLASLAFLAYTGLLLFTSLLFSLNALLLNPDLDLLLSSPRPVGSVLAGRMLVQVARLLLLSLLLTLPALVVITLLTRRAIVLPAFAVIYTSYPVLPIVLTSVLTLAAVRFIPPNRGKEIVTALSLAAALGINLLNFLFNPAFTNPSFAHHRPRGGLPDLPWASAPWVPTGWAGRAAAAALTGDLDTLLLYLAVLAAVGGLVLIGGAALGGRLYLAGWLQAVGHRSGRTRGRLEAGRPARGLPLLNPLVAAMVIKDWRMRTRDIAQLTRFAMPVLFFLVLFGIRAGALARAVQALGPGPVTAVIGLAPAWVLLLSLSSALGLSALSLEGRSIWIYRASPNAMARLVEAKCWTVALPAVLIALAVGVLSESLLRPGWSWALAALLFLAVQAGALCATMVAVGAVWARFDWTDARRMLHPLTALTGFSVQMLFTGASAGLALGSVGLAAGLHLSVPGAWGAGLLLAMLGGAVIAGSGLLVATERLRGRDLT